MRPTTTLCGSTNQTRRVPKSSRQMSSYHDCSSFYSNHFSSCTDSTQLYCWLMASFLTLSLSETASFSRLSSRMMVRYLYADRMLTQLIMGLMHFGKINSMILQIDFGKQNMDLFSTMNCKKPNMKPIRAQRSGPKIEKIARKHHGRYFTFTLRGKPKIFTTRSGFIATLAQIKMKTRCVTPRLAIVQQFKNPKKLRMSKEEAKAMPTRAKHALKRKV